MSFLFTVCQVGAESALKKEVAEGYPKLKFAYSRPGFITFKSEEELPPDFALRSIFARAYGISIGKASKPDEAFAHARELSSRLGRKPKLHVFERDRYAPGDEPKDFAAGADRDRALELLRANPADFTSSFEEGTAPSRGDLILDLIFLDPESWWIGYHEHSGSHSPFPGGRAEISLPAKAPSRAYVKLEEALLWSSAPLRKGDIAIEIGSAPGGASFALLERGLEVVGIDPGEMAESVRDLGGKRFTHLRKTAAQVERRELPATAQWLLLDMNLAPVLALNTVERIAPWYAQSLHGLILTLKLNDWKFASEIPKLLKRVEKLGMARIRATQLASNRQEICVVALTRAAVARKTR